jgi:hypothetical protein
VERRRDLSLTALTADQIGRHRRLLVVLGVRPAILDRHVLAHDVARFLQALMERGHHGRHTARRNALLRNPTTGIAGCCARAASGQAAQEVIPPMNSRRRMN